MHVLVRDAADVNVTQVLRDLFERPEFGPGVFANSHSVATPALLPDGRVAPESQARGIEMQAPPGGRIISADTDRSAPPRRLLADRSESVDVEGESR